MRSADTSAATISRLTSSRSVSPPSSPSSPTTPLPAVVVSPCAACKVLRRRCAGKCVLAPYFPPNDPIKFTTAHRVFGASNIIKFLQELPESERSDAVSSMVYEANARLRDPVYGCAGAIFQLQKQVSVLQEQLAKAQAEVVNMQYQQSNLLARLNYHHDHSVRSSSSSPPPLPSPPKQYFSGSFDGRNNDIYDHNCEYFSNDSGDDNMGSFWDELHTLDMSV
ncbi:unnamed protein product [Cuscuta epithymum]|uniref:LOB domain-containing protein n=1 Tax=Cuscuta epithymum TaxID=186058 RepID=A0AAV0FIL2_9ASTE|nr:unnamed protein product [Cuscuta epithymum]